MTREQRSKAATRARKVSTIRIFFAYLNEKAELIDTNPALHLETPKQDKRLPKYLSLDDSKKLLDAASNEDNRNSARDTAIITLFLNCGMRLSELVGINLKDIDFNDELLDRLKITDLEKENLNKHDILYLDITDTYTFENE